MNKKIILILSLMTFLFLDFKSKIKSQEMKFIKDLVFEENQKTDSTSIIDWTNFWTFSESYGQNGPMYPSTVNPISMVTNTYSLYYRKGGSWMDPNLDLLEIRWSGSKWSGPYNLQSDDVYYRSDITATRVKGNNDVHVFYFDGNKNIIEKHWSYSNNKWYRYVHTGPFNVISESYEHDVDGEGAADGEYPEYNLTSVSHKNGAMSIFYIHEDHTLRQRYWNPDTRSWTNYNLGGYLDQGVSAVSMTDGRIDVFYVNMPYSNGSPYSYQTQLYQKTYVNGVWGSAKYVAILTYSRFYSDQWYYSKLATISAEPNRIDLVWTRRPFAGDDPYSDDSLTESGTLTYVNGNWKQSYEIDPSGMSNEGLNIAHKVGMGSMSSGRIDLFFFDSNFHYDYENDDDPYNPMRQIKGTFY